MPSMKDTAVKKHIVMCDSCGQKNRVQISEIDSYHCGKCKSLLINRYIGTDEQLTERARQFQGFVSHTRLTVAGLWQPMCKQFPVMRELQAQDWEFFAVIHILWEALRIQPDQNICLFEQGFIHTLRRWEDQAVEAIESCSAFVSDDGGRGHSDTEAWRTDICGFWVSWNLCKHAPSYEESEPSRAIGRMSHMGRSWRGSSPPISDLTLDDVSLLAKSLLYEDKELE